MKNIPSNIILFILAALLFLPGLGGVHLFDWDEINFAEISREMIVSGNYSQIQIGFEPFWEKPPLFFWIQSSFMRIFGVNEFAARLPNALLGIGIIQYLYFLGSKYVNERFGWWWAIAYLGSLLPHLYFRSGIIDPVFNALIFIGAAHLLYTSVGKSKKINIRSGVWAGVFFGAAVLTKGPVVIAIMGLVWLIGFLVIPRKNWIPVSTIFSTLIAGFTTMSTWFLYEYFTNGSWFIEQFISYQIRLFQTQDAGHGGFPGYHFVVVLWACFPMSWFAIKSLWRPSPIHQAKIELEVFRKWMVLLLAVVLVLFTIVQSKIVHYSSLAYYPLSFLAAFALYKYELGKKLGSLISIGLLFNALLLAGLSLALPYLAQHLEWLINEPNNIEVMATIGTPVDWPWWTYLPGIFAFGIISIVLFFTKRNTGVRLNLIFIGTAIYIFFALAAFIGRIENISQRPAIEFCKSQADEAILLHNGYKSYAPFFYGNAIDSPPEGISRKEWLYKHRQEKPVYMISRIHRVDRLPKETKFKKIGGEGAFVFLKKEN